MKMKNIFICFLIALVIATSILLVLIINDKNISKKEGQKDIENKIDTISIDYAIYQELRSEIHENETYGIIIMYGDNDVCKEFKKEVLISFENRKSKVYELDLNKLTDVEVSGVISDITKLMKYDKPTMVTPTLLIMKNGKVVIKQEGLTYNPDITKLLDKNKIK